MFTARTIHSGKLKALFEMMFSNTQDVVLTISKSGIVSEISTVNNAIIYVDLPCTGFDEYVYTYDEPMYIGLGSHVNNTIFKTFKNKTPVTLTISKPYTLDVTIPRDDCLTDMSASFISAQNIYPIPIGVYDIDNSYRITTHIFNDMCKTFSKGAPVINVTQTQGQLSFTFALVGIASKSFKFGSINTSDQSNFFQQFKSDVFMRINKITSFSNKTIRICVEDNCIVILAESQLGTIKVLLNPYDDDF